MGGGGLSGVGSLLGLIRDASFGFSGGAGRLPQSDALSVNEELRRNVVLLKEERSLLLERVEILERKLKLLEDCRNLERNETGFKLAQAKQSKDDKAQSAMRIN